MKGLTNKTVLVTGGTSGIGQAIAVRFAEEGARVAINYRRDLSSVAETDELVHQAVQECVDCVLLPICMGGCPYMFRMTGQSDCHKWKHHIKESLAYYYYYKTAERERKIMQHIQKASESIRNMKDLDYKQNCL